MEVPKVSSPSVGNFRSCKKLTGSGAHESSDRLSVISVTVSKVDPKKTDWSLSTGEDSQELNLNTVFS